MNQFELIVIGGGLTSARAIKAYREAGGDGRIALVSADSTIPYHRPPLSKRYLRGEAAREDTLVEAQPFYDDNDVELLLSTAVVGVEPRERALATANDRRLRYRKLLIASGVHARQLQVSGAELEGVFTLRSLDDATAIRDAAGAARDAVVVGGGFIGIEAAASLTELDAWAGSDLASGRLGAARLLAFERGLRLLLPAHLPFQPLLGRTTIR